MALPTIGWSSDRLKLLAGALPQTLGRPPVVPGAGTPQQLNYTYTPPPGPTAPPVDPNAGHWNNPDWAALIQGDPTAQGAIGTIDANLGTASRARANAIKAAIVAFGAAPKNWASGYGDVDQAALAAANENPYSTMKQLDRGRVNQSADLSAALAGRGILDSGGLTGGLNLVQHNYEQAQTDATQRLLDALGGYEGQFGDTARALEGQRIAAYSEASNRVLAGNKPIWEADKVVAPPPPPPDVLPPGVTGYSPGYDAGRSNAELRAGFEQSKASGGVPVQLPGGGVIYWDPSTGQQTAPPAAATPWWLRKDLIPGG